MGIGLAAHGVVVVQHHRHLGCRGSGQAAGREVRVGRRVDDHLGALRNRVLHEALLTRGVALGVLHDDLRLRCLLLHRFDEEGSVPALEADGGGIRQQEEDLVFRHGRGCGVGQDGRGEDA